MTLLKIDYVSPLPPVRSGIADYSRDLLPVLAPLCDLRVIALTGQPTADDFTDSWQLAPAAETGAGGRVPLYHMGNNQYHLEVLDLALERPGILVLHDLVLHHLMVESTLADGDLEKYRHALEKDHGWIGESAGRARRWGELGNATKFSLPLHRDLLRRQRGVVVHSEWARGVLLESDPELAVRQVPMAVPLPKPVLPAAASKMRARLGLSPHQMLLGTFGFQTPIKRTAVALEALGSESLREVHLMIAGEVSPVLDLDQQAASLGVSDRVHLMGFLDFNEFEVAIATCDLCLNLRYPTAGETSASLLRVLAMGRPAVVSDYAQFAELSEDMVLKVPLGDGEVETLAAAVGKLLEDRRRLEEMGQTARQYVEREHNPTGVAHLLIEACVDLADREPVGSSPAAPAPPTTLFCRDLPGELKVDGAEAPWPEWQERTLVVRLANKSAARWLAAEEGVGGVVLAVHWRSSLADPGQNEVWLPLQRPLLPGESQRFEVTLRKPEGCSILVIEPHIQGISGIGARGGPSWVNTV